MGLLLFLAAGTPAGAERPASENCPLAISDSSVWLLGAQVAGGRVEEVVVSGAFLDRDPALHTPALVLAYPSGATARLALRGATRNEESDTPSWEVRFEDGRGTALEFLEAPEHRRPEAPSDAVVLWPAPGQPASLVEPTPADLPPEVALTTVKTAVDLDGDDRPDILVVEFCCGDRSLSASCEYHCAENWQRVGSEWLRCSWWQPA